MSGIICHHNGRYNIYSNVSDGFIFESSLDIDQLKYWVERQYGQKGLETLPQRLERAHKNGHSSMIDGVGLGSLLCCNRAGYSGAKLSTKDCITRFLS